MRALSRQPSPAELLAAEPAVRTGLWNRNEPRVLEVVGLADRPVENQRAKSLARRVKSSLKIEQVDDTRFLGEFDHDRRLLCIPTEGLVAEHRMTILYCPTNVFDVQERWRMDRDQVEVGAGAQARHARIISRRDDLHHLAILLGCERRSNDTGTEPRADHTYTYDLRHAHVPVRQSARSPKRYVRPGSGRKEHDRA